MDRQEIINELKTIISDYLRNRGLDLVDFTLRYEGRDFILRILVDRPQGGITLDECTFINSEVGRILDEKDILQARYLLEVASPGLDRPLATKNDFLRSITKNVRFFLREPVEGRIEWEGIILKVEADVLYIDAKGITVEIPLSKVRKGKQVID